MPLPRQNAKLEQATRRRREIDQHIVHTRASRALPDRALEAIDRFSLAFDDDFDATIVKVAHASAETFAQCGLACEVAEAHALHPASHDEATPDEHEPLIIAGSMGE